MDVTQPCPRCGGDHHEEACPPIAPGESGRLEVPRRGPRRQKYAPDPLRGTLGFARATYLSIAILCALFFAFSTLATHSYGRDPQFDSYWFGILGSMMLHALAAAAVKVRPGPSSIGIAAIDVANLCAVVGSGSFGFAMVLASAIAAVTSVLAWKIASHRGAGPSPASTFSLWHFAPFALLAVIGGFVFWSTPHRPVGKYGAPGSVVLTASYDETDPGRRGAWAARSSDAALDESFASFLSAWESGSLDSVSAEFEESVRDEVAQRLRDRFQDETGSIVLPDLTEASFGPSGTSDPFVRIDFDGGVLFVNFTRADDAWTASSLEIR